MNEFHTVITNKNRTLFLVTTTNYPFYRGSPIDNDDESTNRQLSKVGSEAYIRAQRRAFSRAKVLAFFNPDLTEFITLTYAENVRDVNKVLYDFKIFIQNHNNNTKVKLKYIYVMERQKRGSIHIHMIANKALDYVSHRKGYLSVLRWKQGYSDVRTIESFDVNFKPYLYLFKYMGKSQRVGRSFIHTSRNFDKTRSLVYDEFNNEFNDEDLLYEETNKFQIEEKQYTITKNYFRKSE